MEGDKSTAAETKTDAKNLDEPSSKKEDPEAKTDEGSKPGEDKNKSE